VIGDDRVDRDAPDDQDADNQDGDRVDHEVHVDVTAPRASAAPERDPHSDTENEVAGEPRRVRDRYVVRLAL
jgi:hypothetical protein